MLVFTRRDAYKRRRSAPHSVWRRVGTDLSVNQHQQGRTLVAPLKCNKRVFNYFGKCAVIDVFLPFSLTDIISALHVDI